MNIIQAIKSGKPFRRKVIRHNGTSYYTLILYTKGNEIMSDSKIGLPYLNVLDIISEDWEVIDE